MNDFLDKAKRAKDTASPPGLTEEQVLDYMSSVFAETTGKKEKQKVMYYFNTETEREEFIAACVKLTNE